MKKIRIIPVRCSIKTIKVLKNAISIIRKDSELVDMINEYVDGTLNIILHNTYCRMHINGECTGANNFIIGADENISVNGMITFLIKQIFHLSQNKYKYTKRKNMNSYEYQAFKYQIKKTSKLIDKNLIYPDYTVNDLLQYANMYMKRCIDYDIDCKKFYEYDDTDMIYIMEDLFPSELDEYNMIDMQYGKDRFNLTNLRYNKNRCGSLNIKLFDLLYNYSVYKYNEFTYDENFDKNTYVVVIDESLFDINYVLC